MEMLTKTFARFAFRSLVCLFILVFGAPFEAQTPEPLPDADAFLATMKETLVSNQLLLSQYTYDEQRTRRTLDKRGRVKKTSTSAYEIFPSLDPKLHYSRLISRDGEPVPEEQLEKQDRKHVKKARKHLKQLGESDSKKQQRREERQHKREKEDREWVDEVFRVLEFELTGREDIDGRPAIVFAFEPRPNYRVNLRPARHLQKIKGRMWVSEEDHQMIRLEVDLMKSISIGGGIVWRIHKGTHMEFQREKVNDEIWLPSESRVSASARMFMVKRLGVDETIKYSNHKKFSADTFWTNDPVREDTPSVTE